MGVKVRTVYLTYVDGRPKTWVPHEFVDQARASARNWMASKDTKGKKVLMAEFKLHKLYKVKPK